MSCAFTRTRLASRDTLPSTKYFTPNARAIAERSRGIPGLVRPHAVRSDYLQIGNLCEIFHDVFWNAVNKGLVAVPGIEVLKWEHGHTFFMQNGTNFRGQSGIAFHFPARDPQPDTAAPRARHAAAAKASGGLRRLHRHNLTGGGRDGRE